MKNQRGEKFNKIIRFFAKIESQSEFRIKLYDYNFQSLLFFNRG